MQILVHFLKVLKRSGASYTPNFYAAKTAIDAFEGNVIELRILPRISIYFLSSRNSTPALPYIIHLLVVYPSGRFAVQIAPAICKKGREQNSLDLRCSAPPPLQGGGREGVLGREETHDKSRLKSLT